MGDTDTEESGCRLESPNKTLVTFLRPRCVSVFVLNDLFPDSQYHNNLKINVLFFKKTQQIKKRDTDISDTNTGRYIPRKLTVTFQRDAFYDFKPVKVHRIVRLLLVNQHHKHRFFFKYISATFHVLCCSILSRLKGRSLGGPTFFLAGENKRAGYSPVATLHAT